MSLRTFFDSKLQTHGRYNTLLQVHTLHLFKCKALGFVKARNPVCDKVVPNPECFRPLQGKAGLTLSQQFQYPVPESICFRIFSALSLSELYTEAVKPYSVSCIN